MKKYFRTQLKKSISLLMAVIMLMSCWVWVAPEKAEAANSPHEGYYYVQVFGNYHDWTDGTGVQVNDWIVTYKDGSGTEQTTTLSFVQDPKYGNHPNIEGAALNNIIIAAGWVPGFPTKVHHDYNVGCGGDAFGVQPRELWVGSVENKTTRSGYKVATYGDQYTANSDGGYDIFTVNLNDHAPYAESVKSSVGLENKTINVPSLGATNPGSVDFTKGGVYDQYGVRIKDLDGYNLYNDNAASTTAYAPENGVWVNGTTVYASADAQKGIPNASGSQKIYLFGEGSGEKGLLAEITLNYPKYTVEVDLKGSVTADNFNPVMDMNEGTFTSTWSYTGAYSALANNWPKGTATANGYTFKGFWTTEQPTTGDAGTNASEATFATPVSSTDFVNVYGGAAGAEYAEKDGKKYYNAGTQWDPATHKSITGDMDFHGWWVPKDIVVKFYDIDGTYLGTQTAKYGNTPNEDWYPNPKDSYNAGAFEYEKFAKQWRDITGAVITEGSYTFGALDTLSLTPIYTDKTYSDKYQVNFVDPANGSNIDGDNEDNGIASGKYDYRHILSGDNIPSVALPGAIVYDDAYTYEFSGWSSQKPASGNYHKVAKDDTSFTENTDWVVRDDITYYAVYRSTVKEYVIAFSYTDSTGTAKTDIQYIPYGSVITTPTNVNRTYATGGYGYTLEGWDYVNDSSESVMLDVDASLVFNSENVFLTAENLKGATPEKPIVFKANYDEGQPTPYTVTFKYKDAKGADKTVIDQVYHGYNITQETVDKLNVPEEYDDGEALYTFANKWIVTEGTNVGGKDAYEKNDFTSFSPTSHVTFEAVYGEGVPFYTVTYIDGTKTYSERILAGSNVPAWTVKSTDGEGNEIEEEYKPAKAKTETGEYEFEGWFDEEQTDKDFAQTNGTEYTTESKVTGDLVLYPQFKFSPFKFTIKFMSFDGKTVLGSAEVEAGESFKDAYDEAIENSDRAPDDTYSYAFIGWDYKVPDNFLCEGKDMTYTAQYEPSYIYYKVRWYNDKEAMEDAAPSEMELVGADGLLAITNHIYKGAVYAPSVDLEPPTSEEEGKSYVFAGWKYLKDGVEADYVRGMTITANMAFYATYEVVNDAVTVTTVVGDARTKYQVEYGKTADAIGTPVDGFVDENTHNEFVGWYADADYETVFDVAATKITEATTIYAKFDVEAHDKTLKELVKAPTYYAKGSEIKWCACSKEGTTETVDIPMLTDTVAPTGTIYLGTQGSWSSDGLNGGLDTNKYYANDDTDIILAINDKGDVNTAYNPSGIGIGIKMIRAFVSSSTFTADQAEAASKLAITIFSDDSQTLNNVANYTAKVGDLVIGEEGNTTKLVDGETYIIYYYAIDKAGKVLNTNVRTAEFTYDATAPVITIEGDYNEATTSSIITYCGKAVIKDIENGATVTVNGKTVAATSGKYEIAAAGNYIITVTDEAGNSATKKIIVTDGHDEVTTEKAVTCTEDGYKKVTCAVCNKELETETITHEGHKYVETVVAPTCDEAGYTLKKCSVCGHEIKTLGGAATGHKHDMDEEDNIIYDVVITAATCCVEGKKASYCNVCGGDEKTAVIPVDTENGHLFGTVKTLKATCTQDGETYQNCKYCFEKQTVNTLPKLNHVDTGRYTKVTTEATCYAEGVETTYCKACDTVMGTAPVDMIGHTLKLVKYDKDTDKTTDYPNGYMQYECQVEGCDHTEGKTAIKVKATYTVTFKGAGANGADIKISKIEGESIEANAVADQTKAKDAYKEYTFAGWKAASTGKVVNLPVKVTGNETYAAEFTATDRIYTHTFEVPVSYGSSETTTYKVIVGKYGDENKAPEAVPTLEATNLVKYEFIKWIKVGAATVAEGETETTTDTFTMTDDATFVAQFREIPVKYSVVYLYGTELLDKYEVNGGAKVPAFAGTNPTKAPDSLYHYTFDKWSIGTDVEVTTDLYIQPVFTATKHTYDKENGVVTKDPTCTATGVIEYTCSCGKKTTDSIAATGIHNMVDGKCTNCGFTESVTTVTITFKDDRGAISSETVTPGTTVKAPEAPTKDSTEEFNYTFAGWVKDGTTTVITATEFVVDSDVVYKASFTETKRTYTVIYFNAGNPVAKFENVEYGANIPAYSDTPVQAYNSQYHYEFLGWSVNNGPTLKLANVISQGVYGETAISAKYATVAHSYGDVVPGTCSEAAHRICTVCGFKYNLPGATTNEHTPKADTIVIKEATFDTTGTKTFYCTSCEQTVTEEIPVKEHLFINIMVYNDDGTPADFANVKLKYNGEIYELYKDGKETDGGFVSFKVDKALDKKLWTAYIVADGIVGGAGGAVKTAQIMDGYLNEFNKPEASDDTDTPDNPQPEEPEKPECTCSCHKNTFWGMLFRLFQKIIRFFGGKDCCADPRK